MATPFPRAQFKALMAAILNIPPSYATWKGEPEPAFMSPTPPLLWANLRVSPSKRTAVGWDDKKQVDNPDGSFTTTMYGRRQIVLSLDLFVYVSPMIVAAEDLLDDLMALAWEPANLAIINSMGLVIEDCGSILPLPTTIDGRWISAAHLDLTVALATQKQAHFPGGNGIITEVTGTGTYTTEAGGTTTQTSDVINTKHP